jgi:hypothetical protein
MDPDCLRLARALGVGFACQNTERKLDFHSHSIVTPKTLQQPLAAQADRQPIKVLNVVGARPNFVKIAPLMVEMRKHTGIRPLLVHTGQHYDIEMSDSFFEELGRVCFCGPANGSDHGAFGARAGEGAA